MDSICLVSLSAERFHIRPDGKVPMVAAKHVHKCFLEVFPTFKTPPTDTVSSFTGTLSAGEHCFPFQFVIPGELYWASVVQVGNTGSYFLWTFAWHQWGGAHRCDNLWQHGRFFFSFVSCSRPTDLSKQTHPNFCVAVWSYSVII